MYHIVPAFATRTANESGILLDRPLALHPAHTKNHEVALWIEEVLPVVTFAVVVCTRGQFVGFGRSGAKCKGVIQTGLPRITASDLNLSVLINCTLRTWR